MAPGGNSNTEVPLLKYAMLAAQRQGADVRRIRWQLSGDRGGFSAERDLDRGVFCSLEELTTALQEWIKLWNDSARPFKWTKTPDQIIDSICRYCARISRPAY